MIVVVDNYDSFTYNLEQYLGELGEEIKVRRNNEVTIAEIESLRPDRIVISPGPGTPDQAGISLDVIKRFGAELPLLGVCLGHQAIGQVAEARRELEGQGVLFDMETFDTGVCHMALMRDPDGNQVILHRRYAP